MSDRTEPENNLVGLFDLPIEQIVDCIGKLLKSRDNTTVTEYTQRNSLRDSYQWDIDLPGESGYISVRKSLLDDAKYKISAGIKQSAKNPAVELAKVHTECLYACLMLAKLAEQSVETNTSTDTAKLNSKTDH
tara:strand:+ start:120 stop:518 length:399 start_codon:yes stop_codon:yes gene_type:complete